MGRYLGSRDPNDSDGESNVTQFLRKRGGKRGRDKGVGCASPVVLDVVASVPGPAFNPFRPCRAVALCKLSPGMTCAREVGRNLHKPSHLSHVPRSSNSPRWRRWSPMCARLIWYIPNLRESHRLHRAYAAT